MYLDGAVWALLDPLPHGPCQVEVHLLQLFCVQLLQQICVGIVCLTENRYLCYQCENKFNNKNTLLKHQESKHSGIKFSCTNCGYQTIERSRLSRHQKTKHEGVKYQWDECDADFTDRSSLRRHKRTIHEGVSVEYFCHLCNYIIFWRLNRNE